VSRFVSDPQTYSKNCPSPLAGEAGWGVAPRLDFGDTDSLRHPPTLTLPRKGGGDVSYVSGIQVIPT
jgi:hypothetical protein